MGHDLQTEWLNSQFVSTGVLCRKAPLSICLTRKSATSAREMNPHVQLFGSTNPRYAFVFGPLVRITGRTITQSSLHGRSSRESLYDRLRHTVIGQQIATRSNVYGPGFSPDAEAIPPGMNGRLTPLINREQLPIVDEPAPPLDFCDRGLGAHGALHELESERTKRRVRHIL